MLNLIGQIIALALTVGGIYLSALALDNPIRKVAIGGLSALGLANLVLIIVTYEKTPDVPHIADAIDWIRPRLVAAWEMLAWVVWRPSVGMLTTFIVGLILGHFQSGFIFDQRNAIGTLLLVFSNSSILN